MSEAEIQINSTLIRKYLPAIQQYELIDAIANFGQTCQFPAGTKLLDAGSTITAVPIVFSGIVKVFRVDEEGREVLLYYIKEGESCAMTLTSCLRNATSVVRAVAESDVQLILLPAHRVVEFRIRFPDWNDFIMDTFALRFDEMIAFIDGISFHRMDFRLFKYLHEKSRLLQSRVLKMSHSDIAREINTSREVVSRLLKQLEREGALHLSREQITLIQD